MREPQTDAALTTVDEAEAAGKLSAEAAANLRKWLLGDEYAEFHDELRAQLEADSLSSLEEAFCARIRFETAGMRGPCGVGPNRINSYTIAESVQGVCDFVRQDAPRGKLRAVVGYDTRVDSAWFAQVAAEVLIGNDIEVHLFEAPRPTPELSHAILELQADLGFMLSASHNPPEDNGLKAYGSHAGQMLPEESAGIIECANRVERIRRGALDSAFVRGTAHSLGGRMDRSYHDAVLRQARSFTGSPPERRAGIVFSSLHGVGETSIIPVLEAAGWQVSENLFVVESQRRQDPRFRGVPRQCPNPERPECLDAGLEIAEALEADMVVATDPDADRLAVHVMESGRRATRGFLTGGQLWGVVAEWALSQWHASGRLPARPVVARNLVTCDLVDDVAESYGAEVVNDIPVGFKYVAKVISDLDDRQRFIMGCEQSYGSLVGSHCADKDAAAAALLVCELCDHLKRDGRNILDLLDDLLRRHGAYAERGRTVRMEGLRGMHRIQSIMRSLRDRFPQELGGIGVTEVHDLLLDHAFEPGSGRVIRPLGKGWRDEDILIARLDQDEKSWVVVRPSGTEPSLKVYINVRVAVQGEGALDEARREAEGWASALEADLVSFMGVD